MTLRLVSMGLPQPGRTLAITAVLCAMSLVVLDAGMANVALPTMARSLRATPATVVLVITAYQAALVMALLPCAAFGERFGYRRVFVSGVGLFTAASVLCALAPSLPWLVAARFAQGLGGAAVMALGVALLRFSVPQTKLGAAIGWNALTVALSAAASPAIGALILAVADWPWLFLVNLPLGLLALLAARALPSVVVAGAPRIDVISIVLNGAAFASLVIGAELLPTSPVIAAVLLATATLALISLIRREMPKAAPMIPLDLLRDRSFRISVIASVCCFAGQTAGLVALPFHLQHSLGQSPLMAGLYMTPWPLSVALAATVTGRLADRFSTAWLCATGGGCLALGLAATALWPPHADSRFLIAFAIICGLGFGLFQVPNNRNLFLAAPPERSGAAGGMQGTARLTGQTAGAVLMTLLFATTALSAAPRIGLAIGAVLALVAGLVSASRAPAREGSARAKTKTFRTRADWLIPAGLAALSIVPVIAGISRVSNLVGGSPVSTEDARFFLSPAPVAIHVIAVSIYCLVGAFQFSPGLRRRHPRWHRGAGHLLVPCGLIAAATGLWMTQFYAHIQTDSLALYLTRLAVGAGMITALILAVANLRRRNFQTHGGWMIRAYALGQGAGTQVLTHLPWFLLIGMPGPRSRAVLMVAGWLINIAVAEWVIQRRRRPRVDARRAAEPREVVV